MDQRKFIAAAKKMGFTVQLLELNTGPVLRLEKKPDRWFECPVGADYALYLCFVADAEAMMDKYTGLQFTMPRRRPWVA